MRNNYMINFRYLTYTLSLKNVGRMYLSSLGAKGLRAESWHCYHTSQTSIHWQKNCDLHEQVCKHSHVEVVAALFCPKGWQRTSGPAVSFQVGTAIKEEKIIWIYCTIVRFRIKDKSQNASAQIMLDWHAVWKWPNKIQLQSRQLYLLKDRILLITFQGTVSGNYNV